MNQDIRLYSIRNRIWLVLNCQIPWTLGVINLLKLYLMYVSDTLDIYSKLIENLQNIKIELPNLGRFSKQKKLVIFFIFIDFCLEKIKFDQIFYRDCPLEKKSDLKEI